MPIVIGGGGFDASPFLAQQRYEQEQLQRAADAATQANMAAATHTANVGAANFQYHDQQQTQQEALARQQAALQHQYAQQEFENTRQTQNDQIAQQQHADQLAHQNALMAQQQQFHGDQQALGQGHLDLAGKDFASREQEREFVDQDRFNQNQQKIEAAKQQRIDQQAHQVDQQLMPFRKDIERNMPELDPATADTLARRYAGQDKTPFVPEQPPMDPQGLLPDFTSDPVSQAARDMQRIRGAHADQRDRALSLEQQRLNDQEQTQKRIASDHKEQMDFKNHPEKFELAALKVQKEIAPIFDKADPFEQLAFARATAHPIPGNPLYDQEIKQYDDEAARKIQLGQAQPGTTGSYLWQQHYKSVQHPAGLLAAAQMIKENVAGKGGPENEVLGDWAPGGSQYKAPPSQTVTPPAPGAATPPTASAPTITSQAQYDALPNGATYIDSTGHPKVKGKK